MAHPVTVNPFFTSNAVSQLITSSRGTQFGRKVDEDEPTGSSGFNLNGGSDQKGSTITLNA